MSLKKNIYIRKYKNINLTSASNVLQELFCLKYRCIELYTRDIDDMTNGDRTINLKGETFRHPRGKHA